ncbi:hypothetical protein ACFV0O_31975 [Kitasatospora sp. NPDC059577]|uniref:hypothetical protein n=1 Tax=Kitasatospora sp. NPDC059577 TaxID=3346873 RepID=UPI0036A3F290
MNDLIGRLPTVPELRDRCRALAVLDAVLSPDDWGGRYYSYDSRWSEDEALGSMRDGQGNDWFVLFSPVGVYGRSFDHEVPTTLKPLAAVPEEFRGCVEQLGAGDEAEPVATAFFWRAPGDAAWQGDAVDGGAAGPFALLLDVSAEAYRDWAEEYFEPEQAPSLAAIEHVLALRPLTPAVVAALNPDTDLAELAGDLAEIGYPH